MNAIKRPTKTEQTQIALARARVALDEGRKRLLPLIKIESQKLAKLRVAYDVAKAAYTEFSLTKHEQAVRTRLGLTGEGREAVKHRVLVALSKHGIVKADVDVVVNKHISRIMATDSEWIAAKAEDKRLGTESERAWRAYNIADSPGSALNSYRTELAGLENHVERLERELREIPLRNERARQSRIDEKDSDDTERQTGEAIKLLEKGELF